MRPGGGLISQGGLREAAGCSESPLLGTLISGAKSRRVLMHTRTHAHIGLQRAEGHGELGEEPHWLNSW